MYSSGSLLPVNLGMVNLSLHNYEEEKKIVMASLEFQDYVLIWWEKVLEH